MTKDKIILSFFRICYKKNYKLYWKTYENKLKKAYENCHKLFSKDLPQSHKSYARR